MSQPTEKMAETRYRARAQTETGFHAVELQQLIGEPNGNSVPNGLSDMFDYLFLHGIEVDGLFTQAQPKEQFKEAKKYLDCIVVFDCEDFAAKFGVRMVAEVVKLYFEQLSTPLLGHDAYSQYVKVNGSYQSLREVVQKTLPPLVKDIADMLFELLYAIYEAAKEEVGRLSEMGMVWAPIVLCPKRETIETMLETKKRVTAIKNMIKYWDKIFFKEIPKKTLITRQRMPKGLALYTKAEHLQKVHNQKSKKLISILKEMDKQLENVSSLQDLKKIHKAIQKIQKQLDPIDYGDLPEAISHVSAISSIDSGEFGMIGKRPTMEDETVVINDLNKTFSVLPTNINRSYFGVYDGHGGDQAARICGERLHVNICTNPKFIEGDIFGAFTEGLVTTDAEIIHKSFEESFTSGTTVVVLVLIGEKLYLCNLGDSEAVLARRVDDETQINFKSVLLSFKHKPQDPDERERITKLGGYVVRGRVFSSLAVTRALGDMQFKKPKVRTDFISIEPYLASFDLTDEDHFIILACDGLWDVLTYQAAVDFASYCIEKGCSPEETSKMLAEHAFEKGSTDNISVVVIVLDWRLCDSK